MKIGVFWRILLPVLALLVLLPAVTTLVFRSVARSFAYREAEENLAALQAEVLSLAGEYYPDETATPDKARTNEFLRRTGRLVQRAKGDAQVFIYTAEDKLVFPYDEPENGALDALADAVLRLPADNAKKTITVGGEEYLVFINTVSERSPRIRTVAVYCPVANVVGWVNTGALIVLAVTFVFAALLVVSAIFIARGITRPLSRLCAATDRAAKGYFEEIEDGCSVRELEVLRRSVNEMSKSLAVAEEAQKRFFQNISHELRTPLMSIGGYAQGIEEGVLSDARGAAHVILSESKRLTDLVNELLTLSRMDGEKEEVLCAPFSLSAAVENAVARVAGLAAEKHVAIEIAPIDAAWSVTGDERFFCRVFDNYLGNAVRHAHAKVEISVKKTEDGITLFVRDDGDGIAKEDLPHLFERGYKGKNGHFGLGLAIAKRAAERCGWRTHAENSPEGGAIFSLLMPL